MRPLIWCLLNLSCLAALAEPATKPNIIFILTDDQGYGDLSAHGNPVLKTPHLDQLRQQSVYFDDYHVSPTCAPTRSALLTGRHEFKNGVTHTIFERERMSLDAITLTQVLKQAGYHTGIFGKWHLGDEAAYQPQQRGFDEVFIHGAGGIGQTYVGSCGDAPNNTYFSPVILHNGKFEKTNGFCTDVFFAQATTWLDQQVSQHQPFYLYLAPNAPHAPYTAKPEDAALYLDKVPSPDIAHFFGMIHNIDENVGKFLAHVDSLGIASNTIVIFMNDNGTSNGQKVFNAGMRGAKGTAFLGGTRAMAFWRWPDHFKPHGVNALTDHIDFFPTICELTGTALSPAVQKQVEGRSLVPLLTQENAAWADRTLVTHVGRWPQGQAPETFKYTQCSVRTTRWHLVALPRNNAQQHGWYLFDLQKDPGELQDVSANNPEVVKALSEHFERWWQEVRPMMCNEDAKPPAENPFKVLYRQQMGSGK
jgi:arylsulfatase